MEIGIADWQTKLKFNCIRTGARSRSGRKRKGRKKGRQSLLVVRDGARKETKKEGRIVWEDGMKIMTDGDGGSGEAVVVGGGGMKGEGGWRKRERESESGRESKPAL